MTDFKHISSAQDLEGLSKQNQVKALRDAYENRTSWLAKGTIRGSGEFVRSGFSKSHFPLELIQNADDETAEKILFEYDNEAGELRVFDDGSGFNRKGVIAVCQQGRSQKTSNKQIGFMGIGFKSLFEVCDRVSVHSNGYHFEFDTSGQEGNENQGNIPGFLRPKWVEKDANPSRPTFTSNYFEDGPTTTIIGDISDTDGIKKTLETDNLSPSVFLFLNNLEQILVRSASGDVHRTLGGERSASFGGSIQQAAEMYKSNIRAIATAHKTDNDEKSPLPTQPVETRTLRHDGKVEQYVLFRNVWKPDDVDRPQFREDINKSDLFVAMRLNEEGNLCGSDGSIRVSPLFSYLPVNQYRETKLDFVVHADFDLTLNREDIQQGSPWNERVVDELKRQVLVPVAQTIANHEAWHSQLEYIVPEERGSEGLIHKRLLNDFVENELKSMSLLKVAGEPDEDVDPGLVAPENAVIVTDNVVELLSPLTIHDKTGTWPIIPEQHDVLTRIKDDIDKINLIDMLKRLSADTLADRNIDWFRRAFVRCVGFNPKTDSVPSEEAIKEKMSDVGTIRAAFTNEIVPIEGGGFVTGAERKYEWGDVKLQPEGGYEGIENEVQELTDEPVVDSTLFSGNWGYVVRRIFIEMKADVLTTSQLLVQAASDGRLSNVSAARIIESYANESEVEDPDSTLLEELKLSGAANELLTEIEENPKPEDIRETVERWAIENWPAIAKGDRLAFLRYLKSRLKNIDGEELEIDMLTNITLPKKDGKEWVDTRRLLFPEEYNPDYPYEMLTEEYAGVFSDRRGEKYCFVDPTIVDDDTKTWHTLLKKSLGVRDEDANKELSGKIGEAFARGWLEDNRGIKIDTDNSDRQQEGWDLKDIDGNFYEVKSRVGRVQNIDLKGKQFEKLVSAEEEDYDYYLISVRNSLRPENTQIQDISDVADVLEAQDELSFDPRNTDDEIPLSSLVD